MSKRNIVHIEIPASNVQESSAFYKQLFGWKMEFVEEMNYTMWEPEMEPGGGFNPLGENVKPGDVLIYVDSADIEADLQRVKNLGGTVVSPKMEIPGAGWFGIFKDPTGNRIALFTSKNPESNK